MIRRVLTTSFAALCACLVLVPAGAGAVTLGIGSADAGMFSSPRFQALHITTARCGLAYDIATRRGDAGQLRAIPHLVQRRAGGRRQPADLVRRRLDRVGPGPQPRPQRG